MSKKQKKEIKISKKEFALIIFNKLDSALSEYQSVIGEKSFINHLKKAAKNIAGDILAVTKKQKEELEKSIKKAVPKKSAKKKKTKSAENAGLKKNKNKKTIVSEPDPLVDETGLNENDD